GAPIGANAQARQLGPRVSIYDTRGNLLARLGDQPEGEAPGQFIAPHGICIDSRGDIYVGEVSWTHTGSRRTPPRELRSLQKLARKSKGSPNLGAETTLTHCRRPWRQYQPRQNQPAHRGAADQDQPRERDSRCPAANGHCPPWCTETAAPWDGARWYHSKIGA